MKGLVFVVAIFAILYVVARRVLRYGRVLRRRTPGLPLDGNGCLTPREQDTWYDLVARYDGSPAREEQS